MVRVRFRVAAFSDSDHAGNLVSRLSRVFAGA